MAQFKENSILREFLDVFQNGTPARLALFGVAQSEALLYDFSQSLDVVAQKISLPRPWEVQNCFGRQSVLSAPKDFKFGEKL